ncbi:hypothetical protein RhiirA1_403203 [Rhizophagus irregularis]|uniref:Uncharacterized protein n=1 Tax=Rhizophagus irregularis TaxID=588596 RepID=A0A2I1FJG5_9GLOM|nr:hypothetical protein RhiirA1_403203 [Rhizophagus irregularis]PKY34499.1 hypothetical protein RhiirB3_395579 [Rhizophagus irregularis]
MLEKVDQLITPEDSYWKNLASKTCKVQLPLLGLYSDDLEFKKGFEIEEYLQNSKEIIADITKDISREELGDSYVSSGNNDTGSEGDVHSDKNIINQDESDKEQYENDGNIDQ